MLYIIVHNSAQIRSRIDEIIIVVTTIALDLDLLSL
jgi:hypothetical protein